MANKRRGEITIDVEGQGYTLCLDVNALCVLEEKLGVCSMQELAAKVSTSSVRVLRTVVHAALQRHHPDLSEADAGDLLSVLGIGGASRAIVQAVNAIAGGGEPARPRVAAATTGRPS